MAITINGSSEAGNIDLGTNGTITDLAIGGLPDGSVDADSMTSIPASKLTGTIADARFPATLPAVSGANLTNLPGGGKILQATTTSDPTTTGTVSISNNTWTDTGITASITPAANTSKILVSGFIAGEGNADDNSFFWRIKRAISGGSTTNIEGAASGNRRPIFGPFVAGSASSDQDSTLTYGSFSNYLDYPFGGSGTVAAVTYTFQVVYNGNGTFYVNKTVGTNDAIDWERSISYITLIEVGA